MIGPVLRPGRLGPDGRWQGECPALCDGSECQRPYETREEDGTALTCDTFLCLGCLKNVPWCFGASGEHEYLDELCDDCWVQVDDVTAHVRQLPPEVPADA